MSEYFYSHDNFIRSILSNKKIAVDYFRQYLPEFVKKHLDFSTLVHLPDTYLSDELKKYMSDIVYSCHRKDRKSAVKVSLLIEHKSYPDKNYHTDWGIHFFCLT